MDAHPDVTVDVQGGGSSVGITQVSQGAVDIGTSSRDLKPEEQSLGLVDTKIAYDVITVIVNPGVKVTNLTKDQVKGIFTGAITNWQQVGGENTPIAVVVRDKASGTREMFDEKAMDKAEPVTSAIETNSNGIMRDTVASTKNAIGYISLGYLTSAVKSVQFNGVDATKENALAKKYPLARYLHMLTKGEAQGVAKAYIDFVTSSQFQNEVVSKEYIPLTQL
jgi:phosphate transport system substrate-binding protein